MFSKQFLGDLAERVIWTFVQAAGALVIVQGSFDLEVLKLGLTAGGLAVVKCVVASRVGEEDARLG